MICKIFSSNWINIQFCTSVVNSSGEIESTVNSIYFSFPFEEFTTKRGNEEKRLIENAIKSEAKPQERWELAFFSLHRRASLENSGNLIILQGFMIYHKCFKLWNLRSPIPRDLFNVGASCCNDKMLSCTYVFSIQSTSKNTAFITLNAMGNECCRVLLQNFFQKGANHFRVEWTTLFDGFFQVNDSTKFFFFAEGLATSMHGESNAYFSTINIHGFILPANVTSDATMRIYGAWTFAFFIQNSQSHCCLIGFSR